MQTPHRSTSARQRNGYFDPELLNIESKPQEPPAAAAPTPAPEPERAPAQVSPNATAEKVSDTKKKKTRFGPKPRKNRNSVHRITRSVIVSQDQLDRIGDICETEERSFSGYVNALIEQDFARRDRAANRQAKKAAKG